MVKKLLKHPRFKKLKALHNRFYTLGMYWTEYRESWLNNLSERKNGDRILDAGCGDAWVKREFNRFDTPVEYFGVDLAVGDENLNYKVSALSDLHQLPFKDNSFDKSISNSVLEHVESPSRVFSEMVRVVRPGGKIFLSVPFTFALHQHPFDYHRFTKYILKLYAVRNNLNVVKIWPMGGFFTVLRYISTNYTMRNLNDNIIWNFIFGVVNFFTNIIDKTIGGPIAYFLDLFDKNKHLTLGYFVVYEKKGEVSTTLPDDPFRCPICEDDNSILSESDNNLRCHKQNHCFPINNNVPDLTLKDSFNPRSNSINKD